MQYGAQRAGAKTEVSAMVAVVEGIYKEGKLELLEQPEGLPEGRVRVVLYPEDSSGPEPRYLQPGKYKSGKMSTLEDFKEAEWHGEPEFNEQGRDRARPLQ